MTGTSADVVRATDHRRNVGRRRRCPRWGCGESGSAAASGLLRSQALPRPERSRRWVTRKAMRPGSRIGRPGLRRPIGGPPTRRRRWFRSNHHPPGRFALRRRDPLWPGPLTGRLGTVAGRSRHSLALRTTKHRQGSPRPRLAVRRAALSCRVASGYARPVLPQVASKRCRTGTGFRASWSVLGSLRR